MGRGSAGQCSMHTTSRVRCMLHVLIAAGESLCIAALSKYLEALRKMGRGSAGEQHCRCRITL